MWNSSWKYFSYRNKCYANSNSTENRCLGLDSFKSFFIATGQVSGITVWRSLARHIRLSVNNNNNNNKWQAWQGKILSIIRNRRKKDYLSSRAHLSSIVKSNIGKSSIGKSSIHHSITSKLATVATGPYFLAAREWHLWIAVEVSILRSPNPIAIKAFYSATVQLL